MAAGNSRTASVSSDRMAKTEKYKLRRTLNGWQIFFIVLTVVIGSGCFTDYGVAAKTAGPPGLLIAVVVVGIVAICAMEGLTEMIQLFPTINPIFELVHYFVDKDLALWVGTFYWLAYASILPLQIITAASYVNFYTNTEHGGWLAAKIAFFYIIAAGLVIMINCFEVKIYGFIESVSGLLKLIIMLVIVFMLYQITGAADSAKYFQGGLVSELRGSDVAGSAICLVIEAIAFSFLGMECMAVTAFEAKDDAALRIPSKFMACVVFSCYFVYAIAASLCLDWKNSPGISDFVDSYLNIQPSAGSGDQPASASALTIAAMNVGELSLARAMNAMFIFCAMSAANSTLYISSRMLYGLAYRNRWRDQWWIYWLATVKKNGVPRNAVLFSALSFCSWLPFTQIKPQEAALRLLSWFFTATSVCIFFMWGSLSLAYIRYWFAFHNHRNSDFLKDARFRRFRRATEHKGRGFSTFLDCAQPLPAFIGLLGSIFIVWVFSTSIFWGRRFTAGQFIQNYTMPLVLPIFFLFWKVGGWLWRVHRKKSFFKESLGDWWYKFDDEDKLKEAIERLSEFRDLGSEAESLLPIASHQP